MQLQMHPRYAPLNEYASVNHFTTVTDPFELAVQLDAVALRYSNILCNAYEISDIQYYWDKTPLDNVIGEVIFLPGARLPTTFTYPVGKTTVLYYYVTKDGNTLSKRPLFFALYLEDIQTGVISDTLADYISTYLNEFYDNTDYTLYDENYKVIKFHHLNPKVFHRPSIRYPNRQFQSFLL